MHVIILHENKVLLEKRPTVGIWGGLHCFLECEDPSEITPICRDNLGMNVQTQKSLPAFRHTFSHYHLDIQPVIVSVCEHPSKVMDSDRYFWYKLGHINECGLAAPVKRLLEQLEH